ncbi:MAG: D-arabinono-1,4-lactone oxidase [Actinomycetota bacterium]
MRHSDATRRNWSGSASSFMDSYDGRPHWGKMHSQTAETLRGRYPEWEAFAGVRARLDPEGRFRNTHLDRVLDRA